MTSAPTPAPHRSSADDPHRWLEEVDSEAALGWVTRRSTAAEDRLRAHPAFAPMHAGLREALGTAGDEFFEMGRYLIIGSMLAAGMQTLVSQDVLLALGSVAMQWARVATNRDDAARARLAWWLGGAFAVAFLVGQYYAWQQLQAAGYYAAVNPANASFYLLTGVHAVHLGGGLVAWIRTAARMARGAGLDEVRLGVELCTVYWHYLLLVWLVLFSLLLLT